MLGLKSEIWVKAYVRRCESAGAFAVIVRRGDVDAGVVAIKIYRGNRSARLLIQSTDFEGSQVWRDALAGFQQEGKVDERIASETSMDPDVWVVEVEGCDGSGFLDVVSDSK